MKEENRERAIKMLRTGTYTALEIHSETGVPRSTIYSWADKYNLNLVTAKTTKKQKAELMVQKGYSSAEIIKNLNVARSTLYDWRKKESWGDFKPLEKAKRRFCLLVDRDKKTRKDILEMERLANAIETLARAEAIEVR